MSIAEDQAADILPPELGKILVIAVDGTSRKYDLSQIDLGTAGADVGVAGKPSKSIYLTFLADGADVWWALSAADGLTISETSTVALDGTPAHSTARPWKCPKDSEQHRRVDRNRLKWLYLKGSGAGFVRIMASSFGPDGVALP